jgi:hypothetical protein
MNNPNHHDHNSPFSSNSCSASTSHDNEYVYHSKVQNNQSNSNRSDNNNLNRRNHCFNITNQSDEYRIDDSLAFLIDPLHDFTLYNMDHRNKRMAADEVDHSVDDDHRLAHIIQADLSRVMMQGSSESSEEEEEEAQAAVEEKCCNVAPSSAAVWVEDDHPPNQAYSYYLQLANESLSAETKNSFPLDPSPLPPRINNLLHDPDHLLSNVGLCSQTDQMSGKLAAKVIAKKPFKTRDIITFYAGRLIEQYKTINIGDDNNNTIIPLCYLEEHNYRGKDALVLETAEYHNLIAYARENNDDHIRGCNTKLTLMFDGEKNMFVVLVQCTDEINVGEEIFLLPLFGNCKSRLHHELFLLARFSHWQHRYICILERALQERNVLHKSLAEEQLNLPHLSIQAQENLSANVQSVLSLPVLERNDELLLRLHAYNYLAADPEHYSEKSGLEPLADVSVAFARSGCVQIAKSFFPSDARLSKKTRIELKAAKPNERQNSKVQKIIDEGYDKSAVSVCEVSSLCNPVRYYTIPSQISHGLLALRDINNGEFIMSYAGELCEELSTDSPLYAYSVPQDNVQSIVPNYYCHTVLNIDALHYGSVARFMNDNSFRRTEAVNTFNQYAWQDDSIHLLFGCNTKVRKGEEIITDYGPSYW